MSDSDKKDMSKKSEKLEIRLSYEDKQELALAAETEGRSVSDLVRGLIRRYIKTSAARLPEVRFWKRLWPSLVGLAVAAFMAGHLATWAVVKGHKHTPVYNFEAHINKASLKTPVLAKDGYETELVLTDKSGDIIITLSVENRNASLAVLQTHICRQQDDICEEIAAPILHFNPNSAASIRIDNGHNDEVLLRLWPPTPPIKNAA